MDRWDRKEKNHKFSQMVFEDKAVEPSYEKSVPDGWYSRKTSF